MALFLCAAPQGGSRQDKKNEDFQIVGEGRGRDEVDLVIFIGISLGTL